MGEGGQVFRRDRRVITSTARSSSLFRQPNCTQSLNLTGHGSANYTRSGSKFHAFLRMDSACGKVEDAMRREISRSAVAPRPHDFAQRLSDENPHDTANDTKQKNRRETLQIHPAKVMLADRERFRPEDRVPGSHHWSIVIFPEFGVVRCPGRPKTLFEEFSQPRE